MKKIIALIIMLCVAGASSAAFAGHRGYGGYSDRHYGYSGHHRHHDGLGIALGVVGGLVLGSALANAAPPPPAVVYERRYVPPRICYQDQVVTGEYQYSRYYGRDVWVEYSYPVTRRVEVPCY